MPDPVIDVNVFIVANGRDTHASPTCQQACLQFLRQAQKECVLVDDQYEIFTQYRTYCHPRGQPGLGDAFFKWLWDNQANTSICRQLHLTAHPVRKYEEFPNDPTLAKFDRSDRVYVAVAVKALQEKLDPLIVNALDSDWLAYQSAFARHNLPILQLCPSEISKASSSDGSIP